MQDRIETVWSESSPSESDDDPPAEWPDVSKFEYMTCVNHCMSMHNTLDPRLSGSEQRFRGF